MWFDVLRWSSLGPVLVIRRSPEANVLLARRAQDLASPSRRLKLTEEWSRPRGRRFGPADRGGGIVSRLRTTPSRVFAAAVVVIGTIPARSSTTRAAKNWLAARGPVQGSRASPSPCVGGF